MGLAVNLTEGNARVGHLLGRIEHPQAEACGEQPLDCGVDLRLAHQLVFERLVKSCELRTASGVRARAQRQRCGVFLVGGKLVALPYVGYRPAVRGDKAGKFPLLAQRLLSSISLAQAGAPSIAL